MPTRLFLGGGFGPTVREGGGDAIDRLVLGCNYWIGGSDQPVSWLFKRRARKRVKGEVER